MKKKYFIFCLYLIFSFNIKSQIYISKKLELKIFSSSPLENIEAKSSGSSCAFNATNGKIKFKIPIKSFKFKRALMEEHFNENYMESDKYPTAEFDGTILNFPDLTKNGIYKVKLTGVITIHGVDKATNIEATFIVNDGTITGKSVFKVKCIDHKTLVLDKSKP